MRLGRVVVACAALMGCGGEAREAAAPSPSLGPPDVATAQPDVDLREPDQAWVRGARVAFDGIAEGLAWPALDKAVRGRPAGDSLTIRVGRAVPVVDVLRAAWTLRRATLRLESDDGTGALRVLVLGARPMPAAVTTGCHLAVFVQPDGSLRVAAPGGASLVAGPDPSALLVRSLEARRASCPLRYVAFGAESDRALWGSVFDVALAVEASHVAGDARAVLGQALLPR